MRRAYLRMRGAWRLWWRYCPVCNSSPPRPSCPVCRGSYDYGAHASGNGGPLSDIQREIWRSRFRASLG